MSKNQVEELVEKSANEKIPLQAMQFAQAALNAANALRVIVDARYAESQITESITEEQIEYMVNRFLSWKLPENFNPDGGIGFKKTHNVVGLYGTNLFDATQADAMVRYLTSGLPK